MCARQTPARTHARTHAQTRSRHARARTHARTDTHAADTRAHARTTARACAERVLGGHGAGPHAAVGEGAGRRCAARHAAMQCNAMPRIETTRDVAQGRRGGVAPPLQARPCPAAASPASSSVRCCACPLPVCAFARMCSSEWRAGERDGGDVCAVALNAAHRRLTALGFSRSSPSEVARAAELFLDRAPPFPGFLSPGLGTHRPAGRRVAQQTASRARGVFEMRLRRRHLRRRCRRHWPSRRRTPHGGG
jgi:hypothetical protein